MRLRRVDLTTRPARMHDVQTWSRRGVPSTRTRTRWMFGSHLRFVRRCECETFIPKLGDFPHTSHTAATTTTHLVLGFGIPSGRTTAPERRAHKPGDQRVRLPSSPMRSHAGLPARVGDR